MQPIELAEASAAAIHDIPAAFMLDPVTYQHGAELGYAGADFYFAGRGAVLGDVAGDVAAATFVFFSTDSVAAAFERGGAVQTRGEAARSFAECGHNWAREHLSGDVAGMVAALAGKVVAAADSAGAPLFAGWRALEVPADAPAAAQHQLNALRELRGAYHGGSILGTGLMPREALAMEHPAMAPIHGWTDDYEVDETRRGLLEVAHRSTNKAMANVFSALNNSEADEFAAACAELHRQL